MASSNLRFRSEPGSGELPMDALYEILLRLSAKELCRLRAVCRPWRSLLSDPGFIAAHAARHPGPLIVAAHDITCQCCDEGVLCDILDHTGQVIKRIPRAGGELMWFAHLEFACVARGSMRCCQLLNLATEEEFLLPEGLSKQHAGREHEFFEFNAEVVFGQVASTREYKVLRVFQNGFYGSRLEQLCEIFTLSGSAGARWRGRKAPPGPVSMRKKSRVVLDGIVYFFLNEDFANQDNRAKCIASFDLLTEEWRATLRGPVNSVADDNPVDYNNILLAALNGSLVVVHPTLNGSMDLWFLMDFERGLWVKQHSVQVNLSAQRYEDYPYPLLILNDGTTVAYIEYSGALWICNPSTNTCTDVAELRHCFGVGLYSGTLMSLPNCATYYWRPL